MRSTLLLTLSTLALSAPAPAAVTASQLPGLPLNIIALIPKYLASAPASACNISTVTLPTSTLPAPDSGLKLVLVSLGRGTQNYTCASSTSADKPVAAGAVANMFDANCLAAHASSADLARYAVAKEKVPKDSASQFPLPQVGIHEFSDLTTPVFALSNGPATGRTSLKKNAAVPAPDTKDVPWLKLVAQAAGTSTSVGNVYRVNTVLGQPPTDCTGLEATFTVEYAADYYFFAKV